MNEKPDNLKNKLKEYFSPPLPALLVFVVLLLFSLLVYGYVITKMKCPLDNSIILNHIFYSFQTAAALLAAYNISRVTRENKESQDYNRKEYSFKFVQSWDSPVFLKARDFSRSIKKEEQKEYIAKIKHNPELRSAVILLFNFADNARLGLKNKILDEKIIMNLAPTLVSILKKYEPYMKEEEWSKKTDSNFYIKDFYETLKVLRALYRPHSETSSN